VPVNLFLFTCLILVADDGIPGAFEMMLACDLHTSWVYLRHTLGHGGLQKHPSLFEGSTPSSLNGSHSSGLLLRLLGLQLNPLRMDSHVQSYLS
jgi:hypothetical protein